MFDYRDLVGLEYRAGRHDCYSCVRNFYRKCGLTLPNLARPDFFWSDPNLDLYSMYADYGFEQIFDQRPQFGDAVLMPVQTAMNSHAGVIVENGQMLHHFPRQLSRVEAYRPRWSSRTTVHLRHPEVVAALAPTKRVVHLHEVLNAPILRDPGVRRTIDEVLGSGGGEVRRDPGERGDRGAEEPG